MPPGRRRGTVDLAAALTSTLGAVQNQPETPAQSAPEHAVPSAVTAAAIPEPHSPAGHGQLSAAEVADLATCEAALDNLRLAFAAAGKALAVIQAARLYRATHDAFEDYVEQRWGMGKSQAYRLIEAWPLAERLSPIGERLTESHVRELLPLAGRHGQDAAAAVYQAVDDADGIRVTAAVLHDVVALLPADYWDPDEAVRQIRAYLAGDRTPPEPPPADPLQAFTAETTRLLKSLRGIAAGDVIKAARSANPDMVRETIASVRAVLDQIEDEVTA